MNRAPLPTASAMTEEELPPDNDERRRFLERRQRGIGASDAAAILGLSPWSTPLRVYHDKVSNSPRWDDARNSRPDTAAEKAERAAENERQAAELIARFAATHPHPIDGTHEGLARDCEACEAEA